MTTILLVDDDPNICSVVRRGLRFEGYAVRVAEDGPQALEIARTEPPDLVVLDVMLPGMDGLEVCRRLRRGTTAPILMLTARDAVRDRIAGLDSGADDYLVKPFDLDELAARIRALGRRQSGRAAPTLAHRDITLDPATREVTRGGTPVALSPREFALLQALMTRPSAVLSRAQLEERLYGWSEPVESNAVEVHLHALRRKLGSDAIRNVRGVGWTLG
jgi:two-component system response regulator QseB